MHYRIYAGFLLIGLLLLPPMSPVALAAPLTSDQCAGLRQLKQELKTRGVEKNVAKGAKWAVDNLNAAQLSDVGAFLKLGEEIKFRCGKHAKGGKKKSVMKLRVRVPVRNPRRVRKEQAEKAKLMAPSDIKLDKPDQKMSPEVESVLSAVTEGKKDETVDGKSDSKEKSPEK